MEDSNIDIVIPWVNGNDPNWQKIAKLYMPHKDFSNERFRDWDTLRYLFRSIEKYASWIHKVYLVTDKQIPDWLNTSYDKVTIVDHTEIIDNCFLPTFNSSAIIPNVYKINGLSEQFLLANDDMIFAKNLSPTDFFEYGLPKDFLIESAILPDSSFSKNLFNNMVLVNQSYSKRVFIKNNRTKYFSVKYSKHLVRSFTSILYKKFLGFYSTHGIQPYLKSTFEKTWDLYNDELTEVSSHKTRTDTDLTEWLMRFMQLASGNFIPTSPKHNLFLPINKIKEIDRAFASHKYNSICLNDTDISENENFNDIYAKSQNILKNNFPNKSNFEK